MIDCLIGQKKIENDYVKSFLSQKKSQEVKR